MAPCRGRSRQGASEEAATGQGMLTRAAHGQAPPAAQRPGGVATGLSSSAQVPPLHERGDGSPKGLTWRPTDTRLVGGRGRLGAQAA